MAEAAFAIVLWDNQKFGVKNMKKEDLLKRIEEMTSEDIAEKITQALEESGIPYEVKTDGSGHVVFSGLDI